MKAAGREDEVHELLGYVSKIVPDNALRPPEEAAAAETPDSGETGSWVSCDFACRRRPGAAASSARGPACRRARFVRCLYIVSDIGPPYFQRI